MWDLLSSPNRTWLCNTAFYEYTSLFIHYPAEGYLGCFWFLAPMNSDSVSILQDVHPFLLGVYLGVELSGGL